MKSTPSLMSFVHLYPDLGPLVSLCVGVRGAGTPWWDILHIGEEKVYDLIDGMLLLMQGFSDTRVISGWNYLVSLGAPHFERCWTVVSSCANTWSACWTLLTNYGFHCQILGDMFFKLMSADGQYTTAMEILRSVSAWTVSKDRVTLVYSDLLPG